jgi:hypothetical protein
MLVGTRGSGQAVSGNKDGVESRLLAPEMNNFDDLHDHGGTTSTQGPSVSKILESSNPATEMMVAASSVVRSNHGADANLETSKILILVAPALWVSIFYKLSAIASPLQTLAEYHSGSFLQPG